MSTGKTERHVGKPVDRVDGRLKVTGQAKYAAEYPLDRLAFGALVQSTVSKGKIKNIDSSAAEKLPGVVCVITYKNAGKIPPKPLSDFDDSLHLLQDNVIYHDRQTIGVVVADTFETATHAASLVKVDYDEVAPNVVMDKNLAKARFAGNKKESTTKRGNFDNAQQAAVFKVQRTYSTPQEIHSPMEPHATTAYWDNGKLVVYESTQAIFNTRNKLAKAFGVSPADVRVITNFVGGGFGTKLMTWSGCILAALAAKQSKRPVRLALTRANLYGNTGHRPQTVQTLSLCADKDAKLLGIRHDCVSSTCTFNDFVEDGTEASVMLYRCPNVVTSAKVVPLDLGKPIWMRAPGHCPGTYALECAMDELSYEAKIDPLKLRQINYADKDESNGLPWSSKSLDKCYDKGAELFRWHERNPVPGSMKKGNRLVGWGMSSTTHPTFRMKASAKLNMNSDGSVSIRCGTQDIGTGTYTIMTQIAADTLGLPLEKVAFHLGDTEMPEAPMSGGSMTAATAGSAIHAVCEAAVNKLAAQAGADKQSPLMGAKLDDIEAVRGGLYLKSKPETGESYSAILARSGSGSSFEVSASAAPQDEAEKHSKHSFGAHFAEVEVDPELGTIRVTRFVSAVSAGRILNPKTAGSQVKGGIIYGIGMALTEELIHDEKTGRTLNADLAEYHIPVHADIPNIETIFIDEEDNIVNPIGVKGIGEIAVIGVAAAVANAVYHATGKRIRDLPITLDKIM